MTEPPSRSHKVRDEQPVQSLSKKLTRSGSGGGVSLHFDAQFAATYSLDPETEVEVTVVEKDGGDVAFEISNLPAGFTYDELVNFAESEAWIRTDEYVDPETNEWYLTFRNADETVRIELDSQATIDGAVVNNVLVYGEPIDVTDDWQTFTAVCAAAQRHGVRVRLMDSDQIWERLRGSPSNAMDALPDAETFEQLCRAADGVTAQLVCYRTSLNTTLQQLHDIVADIETSYEQELPY